jgi:G3E family GTPase
MKVLILGGFLGSGKTTALMGLARYLTEASASEREMKVVILENEVGEVGIDDAYLRGGGLTVNNLFSGCACCTVSGEFVTAVSRIRTKLDPEWIVIETTGVAYPASMRENLKNALGIDSLICILVDASRWSRLFTPLRGLLRDQLDGADTVLVNKVDIAGEEKIAKVEEDILGLEPKSEILKISAVEGVPKQVWEKVAGVRTYE